MWKCVSMRPPVRWMSSADQSIWDTATECRVSEVPGRFHTCTSVTALSTPPTTTATQTCACASRALPAQA